MLRKSIVGYHNRSIATAEILEELIRLAREVREAERRGEDLGLSEEEAAFYEALEVNDSAVRVLGEPTLKTIARELVQVVRGNVTIDWTIRENVRAKMRVIVKGIVRKHGYPPEGGEGDANRARAGGATLGRMGSRSCVVLPETQVCASEDEDDRPLLEIRPARSRARA
jgi:restriction endonuclease HindI-like protein